MNDLETLDDGKTRDSGSKTPIQLMNYQMNTIDDVELAIKRIEKHVELHSKMTKLALKVTNETDWIDESGHPYLEASGAKKIRMCFGCSINNVMYERVDYPNNNDGPYFVIEVVGDISWNGQTVPETGTCSSKDAFFAKRKGMLLPMSEIDVTNIRKKALTNFWNRAIKSILGLSFTWNEIEQYTEGRVTKAKCVGVEFKKDYQTPKPVASQEQEMKKQEIKKMMLSMYGEKEASDKLEKNTTFNAKDGSQVKGKRTVDELSPKQIDMIYDGILKAYQNFDKKTVSTNTPLNIQPKQTPIVPTKEIIGTSGRTRASLTEAELENFDKMSNSEKQNYLDLPF